MKQTFLAVLVALCITGCSKDNESPINEDPQKTKLMQLLTQKEADGFYGSVLIQKDNEILINNGYGFKNIAENQKNDPNTIFDIGSVTKQFTAAAILKLEMQEKLSVEDSLHTYLKNVPKEKQNITIHQLLTHSSGLIEAIGSDYDVVDTEMFLTQTFSSELQFSPGEKYAYSNVGYSILGILIEKISGQTYEEYLRNNLWIPAGMNKTGYRSPDFQSENIAHGYQGDTDFGVPNSSNLWFNEGPYWHLKANGGILSSTQDMKKWHEALNTNEILNEEAKQKLFFKHILEETDGDSYYGYGWVIQELENEVKVHWHDGGNDIFYAQMFRFTEKQNSTVIILSNQASEIAETLILDIVPILF
ncbi:serine hydrolase domain-containing protein [Tenacibaculum agarivorans]|uniref:serine hydrolase domain-containing protein n=1 Tax=Tenacibaculum agarivorans TaxID=1908389 RepID=UPI00094B908E|nr:serine hydrolase domain-containing protein [Tenacibaculum agarivorans]